MVKVRFEIGAAHIEAEYENQEDAEEAARALCKYISLVGTERAMRTVYEQAVVQKVKANL